MNRPRVTRKPTTRATMKASRALRLAFVWLCASLFAVVSVEKPSMAAGGATCTTPPVLSSSDTGTTVGQGNDVGVVPLACNGTYTQVAGADVFYRLIVGTGNNFSVTVTPGAGYDTSIYLLSTCGDGATCTAGRGSDVGFAGEPETLNLSGIAPGSYYLGIDSFYPSSDAQSAGSYSVSVGGNLGSLTTTTSITSSAEPSVFGQSVTFTATVDSIAGAPTGGNVQFKVDGATVATNAIDAAGKATFSTNTLAVGAHSVVATYAGSGRFPTSAATTTANVAKASTTTTLQTSGTPSVAGNTVTFTAHVAAVAPGAGTPTGTVVFTIDGATQSATVSAAGDASIATSALTKGSHVITASYSGSANYGASAAPNLNQVVSGIATTTAVTASVAPSVFGQNVTFTAAVQPVAGGVATGAVIFTVDAIPSAPVALDASGRATYATNSLAPGSHSVSAAYGGDTMRDASNGLLTQIVNKASTTTTLAVTPNPAVSKQDVTLKATVAAVAPGAGMPGGVVTFLEGATTLGRGTLDATGIATLHWTFDAGSHAITASYGGDTNFLTSATAAAQTEVVNKASSTTDLSSSANPSVATQTVTFTARVAVVAPGAGTATGTVTFMDGANVLGTGAVDATGRATFTTATLAVGNHSITANYGGDANVLASASPVTTEVINASGAVIAIASSLNPSTKGVSVKFTATVTAVGVAATPTGTVTFADGTADIGSATLAGGTASFSTALLAGGTHDIRATYAGDANFTGGANATVVQIVDPAATTTTLASSPNPSSAGDAVTFLATVSSSAGTPDGVVTFVDEDSHLGTATLAAGKASFVTSSLTAGVHHVHVEYAGNADFAASLSADVVHTVKAASPDAGAPDGGASNDGGTMDGGGSTTTDGGSSNGGADAGADGEVAPPGDGSEGGCSVAGNPSSSSSLFGLFALVGLVVASARGRSKSKTHERSR